MLINDEPNKIVVFFKRNFHIIFSFLYIASFLINSFAIFLLDLYKVESGILQLLGFVITHCLGLVLIHKSIKKNLLNNKNFILCLVLLSFICIRIFIDTDFNNLLKVCFYKYGIINYFILGSEFFVAIKILRKSLNYKYLKSIINDFSVFLILVSYAFSTFLTIKFLALDLSIEFKYGYYQVLADNTYVIAIILIALQNFVCSTQKKYWKIISYSTIFNLLLTSAIVGSTVVFLYVISIIIIDIKIQEIRILNIKKVINQNLKYLLGLIFLSFLIILIILFMSKIDQNIEGFSLPKNFLFWNNSRLNYTYLITPKLFLAPIYSRIEIIRTFPEQFSVNPFLGNWNAEFISGFGDGFYIHSLILSSLTHTGIVGFVFLGTILFRDFRIFRDNLRSHGKFFLMNLLSLFILGSFIKFITFMPFWFLIGYVNYGYKKDYLE